MTVHDSWIDVLTVFLGRVVIEGWLHADRPVRQLELRGPGLAGGGRPLRSYGQLPSPDVVEAYGPSASHVRFAESLAIDEEVFDFEKLRLVVRHEDGTISRVLDLMSKPDRAGTMIDRFLEQLSARPAGTVLEVGSRARSGITRRALLPEGWSYVGLDVMEGPNVDVVGDAHEISGLFEPERFDAVMAFSVLEHLLMPWKFAIQLNAVLKPGGVGIFTTHQGWPVHDAPWDFWRYTDRAWTGLLNEHTGFEILEATMGEPAFTVAQRAHRVTNFGRQPSFLASNVMFRKSGPTTLQWPVTVESVTATEYPEGNLAAEEWP
jgi:2-polyprenyl-3-methyl-5-hydroxy-6-metoxy-1,4-benzoquinol methylase